MTSWSSVDGLGRSRGLCWRSWAALGSCAVLGRKVAQTRAGERSGQGRWDRPDRWARWARSEGPERSGGPVPKFSVDVCVYTLAGTDCFAAIVYVDYRSAIGPKVDGQHGFCI